MYIRLEGETYMKNNGGDDCLDRSLSRMQMQYFERDKKCNQTWDKDVAAWGNKTIHNKKAFFRVVDVVCVDSVVWPLSIVVVGREDGETSDDIDNEQCCRISCHRVSDDDGGVVKDASMIVLGQLVESWRRSNP